MSPESKQMPEEPRRSNEEVVIRIKPGIRPEITTEIVKREQKKEKPWEPDPRLKYQEHDWY
jgi:hypothetical protein